MAFLQKMIQLFLNGEQLARVAKELRGAGLGLGVWSLGLVGITIGATFSARARP